ncbi:MAG: NAD-binding protein [Candidatus Dormibacteraceae bacterium]
MCGYGRVGRHLVDALQRRAIPTVIIEYNPTVVADLRRQGLPAIFGDASNPEVLQSARLGDAHLVAALVPDASTTQMIVTRARRANRRVHIIARARDAEQIARLRHDGANSVVQPEFEAGVEVIRYALRRYGVYESELDHTIMGRRRAFYQDEGEET